MCGPCCARQLPGFDDPAGVASGPGQDLLQHVLALDQPLARHVGAPAALNFSQVADRDIDGRTQVDGELGLTRDLMVAQPDNLGTQRDTPRIAATGCGRTPNQIVRARIALRPKILAR